MQWSILCVFGVYNNFGSLFKNLNEQIRVLFKKT